MEDFFKRMDGFAQKAMDNGERVLKAINAKNGIEDKAKEYVIKQVVPKIGITMPISPLIEANVRMETEDAFIDSSEWMLEKAKLWLIKNLKYTDDISNFQKAMDE